jgi:hypothetical protein
MLTASSNSLTVPNQRVGTTGPARTVQLTATGGPVSVTSVSLSGPNPGEFPVQTDCVQPAPGGVQATRVLAPGDTCTIAVHFAPGQRDTRNAEVDVANDSAQSPKRIGVQGVGTVGYELVEADGTVRGFGDAREFGDVDEQPLNAPIVGAANTTIDGDGYWLLGGDGGIFSFGNAAFQGSTGGQPLNAPLIGMAPTPGHGAVPQNAYWLAARDGGVFSFGGAPFWGSMGGQPLNAPIVGMASTPTGNGYLLVASDGGVFAFGDASFQGSMGGLRLNAPIVGMAATPTGRGYWLVASDGGVFNFGDAGFFNSIGGTKLSAPIVDFAPSPTGQGYWLVGADGGVFSFGDAPFRGGLSSAGVDDVVAMAGTAPPMPAIPPPSVTPTPVGKAAGRAPAQARSA